MFSWLKKAYDKTKGWLALCAGAVGSAMYIIPQAEGVTCECGDLVCDASKGYLSLEDMIERMIANGALPGTFNSGVAAFGHALKLGTATPSAIICFAKSNPLLSTAMMGGSGLLLWYFNQKDMKGLIKNVLTTVFPKMDPKTLELAINALSKTYDTMLEKAAEKKLEHYLTSDSFKDILETASEPVLALLKEKFKKQLMNVTLGELLQVVKNNPPKLSDIIDNFVAELTKPAQTSSDSKGTLEKGAVLPQPALVPLEKRIYDQLVAKKDVKPSAQVKRLPLTEEDSSTRMKCFPGRSLPPAPVY